MKHLTVFTLLLLLLAGCQTDITTDEDSESVQATGDSNSETAGGKEQQGKANKICSTAH